MKWTGAPFFQSWRRTEGWHVISDWPWLCDCVLLFALEDTVTSVITRLTSQCK